MLARYDVVIRESVERRRGSAVLHSRDDKKRPGMEAGHTVYAEEQNRDKEDADAARLHDTCNSEACRRMVMTHKGFRSHYQYIRGT